VKRPKRILICRPDRIGDVVLATPLIREIKRNFPEVFLATLTNPYTKDILLNNPYINGLLCDDQNDKTNYPFWKQVSMIRKYKFDTALLLLPTERLTWMLFLAGIPKRISVGVKLYQYLTFTRYVNRNKYIPLRHEADYCMDLGRKLGIKSQSLDTEVYTSEAEKKVIFCSIIRPLVEKYLTIKMKFICVHPGNNHSAPNWSIQKYYDLVNDLTEDERNIIFFTGGKDEKEFEKTINKYNSPRVINLIGKLNLRELCALISLSDILISSSTGPMHIAAGLKIPTVSLFCPLTACSPELWGPKGNRSIIINAPENFCKINCKDDPHNCVLDEGIKVDNVINAISKLLYKST
jgi:heptosyltransferase III